MASLLSNHTLIFLLESQHSKKTKPHHIALNNLTPKQCRKVKSAIVDSNDHLNSLFPSFDNFHKEFKEIKNAHIVRGELHSPDYL